MSTAGPETDNESLPACPPGHLPAGSAQAAERIHRAFLDILAPALAGMLETAVSTAVQPSTQSTSGDFLDEHESAGCLVALDLSPLAGCAVLSLSRELLFGVLDILTATPAIADHKPRETVTAIELHILQDFFDAFKEALSNAWRPVYPVAFDILATGPEQSCQAASAQKLQAMIVLKSSVQFGEADAAFEIALPGFLLRLAEAKARQLPAREGAADQVQESLLAALGEAALQVEAVLNGSGVRIGDLLSISPGQILSLGTPPDAIFECLVNGKSRFTGEMFSSGGRQAFRVEAPVASSRG